MPRAHSSSALRTHSVRTRSQMRWSQKASAARAQSSSVMAVSPCLTALCGRGFAVSRNTGRANLARVQA